MAGVIPNKISDAIDEVYRSESRRILATLIRLIGDFDLAEEAMQDAFASALQQWPKEGMPANPRSWLISTGRFKAIDVIRRRVRFDSSMSDIAERFSPDPASEFDRREESVCDDDLRLIFTCCHPDLPPEARIALTLREVCGLTTEEIARAFLASPATVAQRIVRAKAKIRDAKIPYQVPNPDELPGRLDAVLSVVYLVFNEGYSASFGESVTRADLSTEAIRLGRLLVGLLPEAEVVGLLALMLLQESRRAARTTSDGDLILLEDQDRSRWDAALIAEGQSLVEKAIQSRRFGPYTIQAAIAAIHSEAVKSDETDWNQIAGLYEVLFRIEPSPVVELNRAVAIAMRNGPNAGVDLIDTILDRGDLTEYHLAHAARAELCRRAGRLREAMASYENAIRYVRQNPERRYLEARLDEISKRTGGNVDLERGDATKGMGRHQVKKGTSLE